MIPTLLLCCSLAAPTLAPLPPGSVHLGGGRWQLPPGSAVPAGWVEVRPAAAPVSAPAPVPANPWAGYLTPPRAGGCPGGVCPTPR